MKKKVLVVCSILLALFMVTGTIHAALWCHQLKGCAGAAGCQFGGDVDGCIIDCLGGGQAKCDVIVP